MAQRTLITIHDDFTDREIPAEDTVGLTIAVDGVTYEFDTTSENKEKIVKALTEKYLSKGRKVKAGARTSSVRKTRDYDPATVRQWASTQGIEVPARGRIPQTIVDAYRAGHAA